MHPYSNWMNSFQAIISPLDKCNSISITVKFPKEYLESMNGINYTYTCISNFGDSIPYFFSGLFTGIRKIDPLLSNFYLDNMLNKIKYTLYIAECQFRNNVFDFYFYFSHGHLFSENYLIHILVLILNSRLFQIASLCTVAYLMQKVSGIFSNKVKLISYFSIINTSMQYGDKTSWIRNYIYKLSYNKFYMDILLKVYNNIRNLIIRFCINYKLSSNKFVIFTSFFFLGFIPNIIKLNSTNFNTLYATLTIVYVFLGWILDYLSFIWIYLGNNMDIKSINTLSYWYKHILYAITYISWLLMGVISTNGLYFSVLENIDTLGNINLIITIVGSLITYIFSNLWYIYGGAIIPESFNLFKSIKDLIINSLLTRGNYNNRYSLFKFIKSKVYYWLIKPNSFNSYSSFRRSVLEWLSFFGMVLSTYGSWNLYNKYALSSLSILVHIFLWGIPTLFSGYVLIYLEVVRPSLSYLYYGLFYLMFWTSICFSSNSVLVGYITVNNAASIIGYILPINLVVAFVYSLPLYRASSQPSLMRMLAHLVLFVLLTYITLLSAGTIWTILASIYM